MTSNQAILKHLLNDSLPDKIFFDTNFFVSFIFSKNPKRDEACKKFLKKIINETISNKNFVICFNTFIYYEAYLAFAKHQLQKAGKSPKLLIDFPHEILPYKSRISRHYELLIEILKGLRTLEFKLNDKRLVEVILNTQVEYRLQAGDAFHLGTMLYAKEKNLASFDIEHFKNIPNINLWCLY